MPGRGLILAAPASGGGKTLIAAGIIGALRRRGWRVAPAKAGPDYIDPTFHAAASGSECPNLDLWGMRPATLSAVVAGLEDAAELVVCEGAMGLFDGAGRDGETGSTAELARLTGWPVVLVVDAARQGASVAALVGGFARHDRDCPIAAIVLNRVGSERHRVLLEAALARHVPEIPCLGAVPRDPRLSLPSRHLGLVPARERPDVEAVLASAAKAAAGGLDLDRLVALARPAGLAKAAPATPLPPLGNRIAVARDDAFLFAYPVMLDGWRRQGAVLSFFSPLADQAPDPGADAVFLPGGYPELHAGRLAGAAVFFAGLHRAAARQAAIYGECGGFMALGDRLIDAAGQAHAMAGLLPVTTSFAEPRLHLGYRAATLCDATVLGPRGMAFRGHEFHYAVTVAQGDAAPLFGVCDAAGNNLGAVGLRRGRVAGSFLHLIDRAH